MNEPTKAKITLVKKPRTDAQRFYGSQESEEVGFSELLAELDEVQDDVQVNVGAYSASIIQRSIKTMEGMRDLAHDLAVELYSSQKIEKGSNAERLIKMAMENIS